MRAAQADCIPFAREDLEATPRPMWGSLFRCASQSVWTALAPLAPLAPLAAPSELAAVQVQAPLAKWRALIPQALLCEGPAPALRTVWGPGVARRATMRVLAGVECMAHFVSVAPGACAGPVSLQAAPQWRSKAGKASPTRRSAWPGTCASAGGRSGR